MEKFLADDINFFSGLLSILTAYMPTLIIALVVFLIGSLINKLILRFAAKAIEKSRLEKTASYFILRGLKVLAFVLVLVIALSIAGVPMNSIIAIMASVGVAVGVAMRDSLSNVASCILILTGKLFRIGDYIEVDGAGGTVLGIGVFTVKLLTPDNRILFVPNSRVTSNTVSNTSQMSTRRFEILITRRGNEPFTEIRDKIKAILESDERIEKESIYVRLSDISPSHFEITVRGVVPSEVYFDVKTDTLEAINREIGGAGE
ncbi:MAG: mechanosensitive ion channel [Ruminococcus sp.]|jgi:small conductance mechanosensitive channel|nr:mechanosensitive ion channel [Ruminococcus sp.]